MDASAPTRWAHLSTRQADDCEGHAKELSLPLTRKTMSFAGSYCEALYRISKSYPYLEPKSM